jgi:diacylglycerol kinase family enzyme
VAPGARIDDGLLDVVVVHAVGPAERVAFAAALLRGTHVDRDDVVVGRGAAVLIRGAALAHNRDGELEGAHGSTRRYTVEPGAWQLLRGGRTAIGDPRGDGAT